MYSHLGILFCLIVYASGTDTRTECLTSMRFGNDNSGFGGDGFGDGMFGGDGFGDGMLGGDGFGGNMFRGAGFGRTGFGFGEMEGDEGFGGAGFGFGEMEADEGFGGGFGGMFGEADEGMEGFGGMAGYPAAAGKLHCPEGNRGSILVKRIKYGASAFPGTCQSVPFCKEQTEMGEQLAKKCNGQSTCTFKMLQPKILDCGRPSSYMNVEYECVDTWATFEICENVNTVARGASVIITSPGYLGTSKPEARGVQLCECIVQSHDGADMYMDYLQTQLSSKGDQCPYEYILVESKKNINQTGTDKEIEVCGNQHIGGRWLQGSVRITYASGGPMKKHGLLARFTADNLGNKPMIQLECGKVDTKGINTLQRAPKTEPKNNEFSMSGRSGFGPNAGTFGAGMAMMPMMPMIPQFPTPTPSQPKPKWTLKIAKEEQQRPVSAQGPTKYKEPSLKVSLPVQNFAQQAVYAQPKAPAGRPGLRTVKKTPNNNANKKRRPQSGSGKRTPKKSGAGKVVADGGEATIEEASPEKKHSGGMVALVFAGIGAVLILGSVGILMIHNYRKRQRIRRKEEVYASGGSASITYGKGWEIETPTDTDSGSSVYATIADVDAHRGGGCVNPAVGTFDEFDHLEKTIKGATKDIAEGGPKTKVADDVLETLNSYDKIALKSSNKESTTKTEIAVIDVHKSFDSKDEDSNASEDEYGLSKCLYATSGRSHTGNTCLECNIVRPPRRKDVDRGYDNNVGVKRQQN